MNLRKSIISLDFVLVLMGAGWIVRGIIVGLDSVDVVYNYVYLVLAIIGQIMNLVLMFTKRAV